MDDMYTKEYRRHMALEKRRKEIHTEQGTEAEPMDWIKLSEDAPNNAFYRKMAEAERKKADELRTKKTKAGKADRKQNGGA